MENYIAIHNNVPQVMSSREIAVLTSKRHDHVLRDCDTLDISYEKLALPKIGEGYYLHPSTGIQQHRELNLTKIQTFDLMTGYSIELRIKVNRRWEQLESDSQKPLSFEQMAKQTIMLADKRIKELEAKVEKDKPMVDFAEKVIDMDDSRMVDVGQTAKLLNLPFGRNTLFVHLKKDGIFFKNRNEPKQQYVLSGLGYFDLKVKKIPMGDWPAKVVTKVFVTQKGLYWLSRKYNGKFKDGIPKLTLF